MLKLVGKNYMDHADSPDSHLFVMAYSLDCDFCMELKPHWEKLADEFKDRADIQIALFNVLENEVEGLYVEGYPTLYHYGRINTTAVEYEGGGTSSLDDLKKWVASRLSADEAHGKGSHEQGDL